MKLTPVVISIILASSTFGYGLASAQQASPGGATPCTASYPCAKICGDHPCAPGEVYAPGGQASANATKAGTTTKSSGGLSMQSQLNVSANATVSKTGNGTMMQTMTKPENGTMAYENQTMSSMNGTMNSMKGMGSMESSQPPAQAMQSPVKQVSSGIAPANVTCPSGYQLVLNKFDSRPACVTADVMAKLIARGWAASS